MSRSTGVADGAAEPTRDDQRLGEPTGGEQPDQPADGEQPDQPTDDDHLGDVSDGAGCTEIWEHLSANRDGR